MPEKVKPKILIVEDELSIREMYAYKLRSAGYQIFTAHDGQTGLNMAKKHTPDIILLDLRMPHMSGDKMLEKLREHDWGANMRVVVMTNISKEEAPSILRFLSVDRYVVKAHTTPAEVVKIVQEILG